MAGTGKHSSIVGLVQFRSLLSGEDVHVGAVVPLPEPCTKVLLLLLLLLLAESGSLVAFQPHSQLGRVLHSSLVGASLLAKIHAGVTPKASYQRW